MPSITAFRPIGVTLCAWGSGRISHTPAKAAPKLATSAQ